LRARTETEAVERALDLVISEHNNNRLTMEANWRFVAGAIVVKNI